MDWRDAERKKKSKVFNVEGPEPARVKSALKSAQDFRQELALRGLVELQYVKCDLRTGKRYGQVRRGKKEKYVGCFSNQGGGRAEGRGGAA